jgi:hypothetical protein
VAGDLPAEAVDEVVVDETEQAEVFQGRLAAFGAGAQVVRFALACGAVAAAGPLARAVAEDDRAAQLLGDVAGVAEIQGQGRAAERAAQEVGAEEAGQAVGAG